MSDIDWDGYLLAQDQHPYHDDLFDAPLLELESAPGIDACPPENSGSQETRRWRGESTANSSLKLGADSGRVMDDSGIVKRCFALEFRRKLSSLPWQPAPHSDN